MLLNLDVMDPVMEDMARKVLVDLLEVSAVVAASEDLVVVVMASIMALMIPTAMAVMILLEDPLTAITATVDVTPMVDSPTAATVTVTATAMAADTKSLEGSRPSPMEATFKADFLTSVVPIRSATASVRDSASAASTVSAAISSARTSSTTTTELIGRASTRNAQAPLGGQADPAALEVMAVPITINTIIATAVSTRLTLNARDKTVLVRVSMMTAMISTSCQQVCREDLSGRLPHTTSTLVVSRTAHTPLWSQNLTSTSREHLLA